MKVKISGSAIDLDLCLGVALPFVFLCYTLASKHCYIVEQSFGGYHESLSGAIIRPLFGPSGNNHAASKSSATDVSKIQN